MNNLEFFAAKLSNILGSVTDCTCEADDCEGDCPVNGSDLIQVCCEALRRAKSELAGEPVAERCYLCGGEGEGMGRYVAPDGCTPCCDRCSMMNASYYEDAGYED